MAVREQGLALLIYYELCIGEWLVATIKYIRIYTLTTLGEEFNKLKFYPQLIQTKASIALMCCGG